MPPKDLKPNQEVKRELNDLPASTDKDFWFAAEIHTGLVGTPVNSTGSHYFIRKSGHQAECTHCGWGFQLDPGDKIKDGHLYTREGKLVI